MMPMGQAGMGGPMQTMHAPVPGMPQMNMPFPMPRQMAPGMVQPHMQTPAMMPQNQMPLNPNIFSGKPLALHVLLKACKKLLAY